MKPVVCVPCRLFLKVKKNGVGIEEGMLRGDSSWGPYKLWQGDLWECDGCGAQIVRGFGRDAISEHFMPSYGAARERFQPLFRVDDC